MTASARSGLIGEWVGQAGWRSEEALDLVRGEDEANEGETVVFPRWLADNFFTPDMFLTDGEKDEALVRNEQGITARQGERLPNVSKDATPWGHGSAFTIIVPEA